MKKENNSWVSENGNEIKEDTLMKLYDVHYKDQQVHIDSFQKHLEIFLTVIAGLITVFIGGMLQFHEKPFAFTLVGIPLFIVFFSEIGKKTIDRFYQRFLESIVIIAKIENILGLDDSISDKNLRGKKQRKPLWIEDKVFLLDRWVEDRSSVRANILGLPSDWIYAHLL